MGPKKKVLQPKPDWTLCSKSGLLYHPKDISEHQLWLDYIESSDPVKASHPHILDNKLTAPVAYVERSQLSFSKLPEPVLLSSVFVSSGVVKLCGLGLGSPVLLTLNHQEEQLVLTAFPISGTEMENRVLCLQDSWLGRICGDKKMHCDCGKVDGFCESL